MGAGEAIEDGTSGVLVPVGDPAVLAEQIVRVGADPERRAALGRAARARIGQEFTAAAALERAERVFRTIAR
jgi:glycosyltransferase involved in cell wall biosynthesis